MDSLFTHITPTYELEDLDVDSRDFGGVYITPKGFEYPSLTTVLSVLDSSGLDEWRKRVGKEEANRVSKRATVRGEAVHKICEDYLNNDSNYRKGQMPATLATFAQLKPILDDRISKIYHQEVALYSKYLRWAGRVDLICDFDRKRSIVDFKTSKRKRPKIKFFHTLCKILLMLRCLKRKQVYRFLR